MKILRLTCYYGFERGSYTDVLSELVKKDVFVVSIRRGTILQVENQICN